MKNSEPKNGASARPSTWKPIEWDVALFRDQTGKPWVAERLERITESGQFLCYSGTLYRQARPFAQNLIGMGENPPFTP